MKRIWMLLWCLTLGGLFTAHPLSAQEGKPKAERGDAISGLVGNWSGESVCVDKEKFPACNDEQVVYRIAVTSGKSDGVTITMDKLVNGKPETMGVLDFIYNARTHTLSAEFTRNRRHGVWEFVVTGDALEGTLSTLPDKTLVRRVKVKKDQ